MNRPQSVNLNNLQSSTIVLCTGAPQGCVLSPVLYSLFTNDCVSHHASVQLIKFVDDTTVEGLIENSDKSAYRQEVGCLLSRCGRNNLELNTSKTMEMIIDFRREKSRSAPLLINGSLIEIVGSFKFLGTTISSGCDRKANINSTLQKAQQRMYFLRQPKKFGLLCEILLQFYRAVIESVLCFSLSVWFSNTTKDQRRRLSRVVKNAGRIIECELPSLEEMYQSVAVCYQIKACVRMRVLVSVCVCLCVCACVCVCV